MKSPEKIFISLALGAIVGATFAAIYFYDLGYEGAVRDVRARLEATGLIAKQPEAIQSVSGRIVAVGSNELQVEVLPPFDPTVASPQPTLYTVSWSAPTVFVVREIDVKAVPKAGELFDPFVEKTISSADLATGMTIIADAGTVIQGTSFVAKKITLIK